MPVRRALSLVSARPWAPLSLAALAAACGSAAGPSGEAPSAGPSAGGGGTAALSSESSAPDHEPPPRTYWLEERSSVHDFGTVYPHALHDTVFSMTAAGEEDLVVSELKHTCGCTAGELLVVGPGDEREPVDFDTPYPPGTRFELHAELNTKARTGEQEQKLHVVLADGYVETYELHADIEPFLVAEPRMLSFEDVSPYEGVEGEVTLTSRAGEPFVPECWRKIKAEDVEVELAPVEPEEEGRSDRWTLSVRIPPGHGGEARRGKLILLADVPNLRAAPNEDGTPARQRLELPILARIDPVVRAWPDRVNFGRVEADEAERERFVLQSTDPEIDWTAVTFRLADPSGERPFAWQERCAIATEPRESPRELDVNFRLRPPLEPGSFGGRILVDLHHPLQSTVALPFRGIVEEPSEATTPPPAGDRADPVSGPGR